MREENNGKRRPTWEAFLCSRVATTGRRLLGLPVVAMCIHGDSQGLGDSKTRSKTKQPEPSTSTVRTLGVDWAAHDKPKLWWAAHGSLVWPYGLRKAAPLWGCGLRTPMGEGRRMSVWLMGHLKILYS
ncbi:hypothetical protein LWI28_015215 [Acer negundo]|uniref:Uncharacterized protein n=1 Tax=Acer negundo TaxID=4023 RepID=A0AAD5JPF5_ACENE|nr:hypothetical protein LWI28_015215 [Acer negundo]